jgi:hypothetical protein
MEKDLFEIFPDLPWPRHTRLLFRQGVHSVEYPPPPATHVARLRLPVVNRKTRTLRRQHTDDAALCRIREIAQAEYDRLTPKGRLGGMLRTIIAVADAAMLTPT